MRKILVLVILGAFALVPAVASASGAPSTVTVSCSDGTSFTTAAQAESGLQTGVTNFNARNPLGITCSVGD